MQFYSSSHSIKNHLILVLAFLFTFSCKTNNEESENKDSKLNMETHIIAFKQTMQKHLDAVSMKDLKTLESTMSPEGKMQLILPNSEIINGVDSFLEYHRDWFKDSLWTFETKIINSDVGEQFGMAITEIIYREPERNGKPYFNRMTVSYVLEHMDGKWYIIKDHASTIEKTKM